MAEACICSIALGGAQTNSGGVHYVSFACGRLIVVVRVMEGKLNAAQIAPPTKEELDRSEANPEPLVPSSAEATRRLAVTPTTTKGTPTTTKAVTGTPTTTKALSTVSGNTNARGETARLGTATRKVASTPQGLSRSSKIQELLTPTTAPQASITSNVAKTTPRRRSVRKFL